MFKCVIEKDKFGELQQHYYLTQGDSQNIYVDPVNNNEDEDIDLSLIENCEFKLSTLDFKQIFSKELKKIDDIFLLELDPSDSLNLDAGKYIYEFVFNFKNNDVDTIQWYFDLMPRVKV